ncbi:unnamed protein product, partial [Closterium sp. NIES-54]
MSELLPLVGRAAAARARVAGVVVGAAVEAVEVVAAVGVVAGVGALVAVVEVAVGVAVMAAVAVGLELSVEVLEEARGSGSCVRARPLPRVTVTCVYRLTLILGASESSLLGTALAEALHTFTLDSGASCCCFHDSTTLTPLPAPVPVRLADPSGGPVIARSSTVLPCPAVPSERYFLLVVDDYTRYTTVFPLCNKGQVVDVLIPWIHAVRLQLREWFRQDLPVLCLHSDRGGEFCSDLLRGFCRGEGILQLFTLPDSPQQNGIAECRIGLVTKLNLWPHVSLLETSPTLRWTGKVGDASVFEVWGSHAFVCDTSADKLSARAIRCVFLGFSPDAPGWQFYHPTSHRIFSSWDVTFDESVPFYRLFPYRSTPPSSPPLILAPGPPPVDPLPGTAPLEVLVGSGAARGAASEGAESKGVGSGGAEPGAAGSGGAEPGGAEPGGAEPAGVEPGGVEPDGAELEGAESGVVETRGARTRGTGAARTGGVGGVGGAGRAGAGGAGDSTEPGAAGAGGAGAVDPGVGGAKGTT